jgi:hypothetical protein
MKTRNPGNQLEKISPSQSGDQVVPKRLKARKPGIRPQIISASKPVMMSQILLRPGILAMTNQIIMKIKPITAVRNIQAIVVLAKSKRGSPGVNTEPRIIMMKIMKPKKPLVTR